MPAFLGNFGTKIVGVKISFKRLKLTIQALETANPSAWNLHEFLEPWKSAAEVVDEGVGVGVALVCGVALAEDGLPVAAVGEGEESVGVKGGVVDEGYVELFCQGEGLTIKTGTADDEDFILFRFTGVEGSGEGGEDVGPGETEGGVVAQDQVAAVGEGSVREGLKGLAPHDDGVAGGERLEAAQVVRQVVEELPGTPDGVVLGYGDNEGEHFFS